MANAVEMRGAVELYLAGDFPLDEFEDWFLAHSWNAHLTSEDDSVVGAAHQIEGILLDYSSGAIGEDSLRQGLMHAIADLPFVVPVNHFGDPRLISTSGSNASLERNYASA